ncbi:uncharacterized protein IL334_007145 [Kwoniella shivajii]|uniref:GP-PDE domain-containing protein n=1 Tax=Kwoniella shivajii TaxID=564305 RepID=A0ABZ1D7W4_9TREE|nr:hypothetical protein IL334_007145 [Kwoniella shivajii]
MSIIQTNPIKPILKRETKDIECWGHRGASAHLPENTLASFQAAIQEGCDGIESDVHATSDGVVLMFHDPTLDRTTTGKGLIKTQPWKGVIEHVRTTKEPVQPIPLFEELIALLMKPENRHVTLNIDCKMQNDPERLFPEMSRIISQYPDAGTSLCPRIILGLWHPLFIPPAYKYLPQCRRYHIGFSIPIVKSYFWDHCEGFSMYFPLLMSNDGQAFLEECRKNGKEITVWTVNDQNEMRMAISWGIKAVLTDKVAAFVQLKNDIIDDPNNLSLPGLSKLTFPWSSWRYYSLAHPYFLRTQLDVMRTMCYQPGELQPVNLTELSMVSSANQVEAETETQDQSELAPVPEPIHMDNINDGKVLTGVEDLQLEAGAVNGILGKVAA